MQQNIQYLETSFLTALVCPSANLTGNTVLAVYTQNLELNLSYVSGQALYQFRSIRIITMLSSINMNLIKIEC